MTAVAKPFLKWAGSKRQLVPTLLRLAPKKIRTYYEPFLGGGALFFALAAERRFERAVLSDANEELIRAWRAIRDYPNLVYETLSKHRQSERHFLEVRAQDFRTLASWEIAARFVFLNRTGFNGLFRLNAAGKFNVPYGHYRQRAELVSLEALHAASEVLKGVSILETPFNAFEMTKIGADDFVYFDPPYLPISDTSNFSKYTSAGFSVDDHEVLAVKFAELNQAGVPALLSNSDCQLSRFLYRGLSMKVVRARRSINSRGTKRGPVNELLVMTSAIKAATKSKGKG